MRSIEIYVDRIGANGRHGETYSSAIIFRNFKIINDQLFAEFIQTLHQNKGASVFFAAGRFVVWVSMGFNDNNPIMSLMDIGKDEELAQKIAAREPLLSSRHGFMSAFRTMAKDYNKAFDRYKLVLNEY